MEKNELNTFQKIVLELMWAGCRFFAILPYWFRYYVVEGIIFTVLYFMRYRMKVVKTNLRHSFPEKSDYELLILRHKFYHTLAELIVDTLSLAYDDDSRWLEMTSIPEMEAHAKRVEGRDWIALTAHYGCWEYCTFWGLYDPTQIVMAVYHPLRSQIMDELYKRLRARRYSRTVAMNDCMRFYMRNKDSKIDGKNLVLGLIADQNPPRRPDSHWFRFLNQDTLFFDGGEKLAIKCSLPVYFVFLKRVRRGCYQMLFKELYDGREDVSENDITERYVRSLEQIIVEKPELWMWSHRRWKHKRE